MNLETVILSHLVYNEDYGRKVLPFLRPEYFTNPADKLVYDVINSYVVSYSAFPTKEALFIDMKKLDNVNENIHKDAMERISQLEIDPTTKLEWLVDRTEKFCQDKAIYNGIMASISILDDKTGKLDKASIPKILSDALAVSFDSFIGHNFFEDWAVRFDLYHTLEKKIPFDIDLFNDITKGGLSRKTLSIILAGTGVGKTLFMCHCAAANLMQGNNVLYITLEMAEERIAERIDANILDVTIDELAKLSKSEYEKKIERAKGKTAGRLIVKEYPTASATSTHFRHLLNELKIKKNFVPDIIYIDYINICASSRLKFGANVNSYSYIKSIAEELRGMAVEYDVPIVSATQTNREGFSSSDVELTNTSESFGLPATADMMFALIVTEELHKLNQILVKQLKNRYSDPGILKRFVIGVDRSKMRIYNTEQSSQDDIVRDDPVMDATDFGMQDDMLSGKKKFNKSIFDGFK